VEVVKERGRMAGEGEQEQASLDAMRREEEEAATASDEW
jgi:hypothetical protein